MLAIPIDAVRHLLGLPDGIEIFDVALVDDHLEVACTGVVEDEFGGRTPLHPQRWYVYTLAQDGTYRISPVDPDE